MTSEKGPPGTGKTTSVLALAHELLGANFKEAVLELNASDDRCVKDLSPPFTLFSFPSFEHFSQQLTMFDVISTMI